MSTGLGEDFFPSYNSDFSTQYNDDTMMMSLDQQQSSSPQPQPPPQQQFTVYPKRFLILGIYCFASFINAGLWTTFAPNADVVSKFYHVSMDSIDTFSYVFILTFVPGLFLSLALSKGWGISVAVRTGTCLMALGNFLRFAVYLYPHDNFSFDSPGTGLSADQTTFTQVWYNITLLGQCLSGLAQPSLYVLSSQIPAVWFPEAEVSKAVFTASLLNPFGLAVGYLLAPALMHMFQQQTATRGYVGVSLEYTTLIQFVAAFIACLFALATFTELPPTPPSAEEVQRLVLDKEEKAQLAQWYREYRLILWQQQQQRQNHHHNHHSHMNGNNDDDDDNDTIQLTTLNSFKLTIGYVFYLLKPMVTDTWKLLQIPNFIFLTLPFSFMMSVMNIVLSSPHIIPKTCLDNVTADLSFYMVPLLMGSGFLSSTIFTTLISLLPLEAPRVEDDVDVLPQDHHSTTNNDNTKGSNQHLTRNAGSVNNNNNLRNDMSVQLLDDEDDVEEYNVDTTPTAAGSAPRMMFVDENNAQLVVIDPSTSNFSKFSRTLSSGHSNGSQLIGILTPSHQGDEDINDLMLFNNQQSAHNNNNNNNNNDTTNTSRMMPKGINTIIKISYIFSILGFLIFFSQLQNTLTNTTIFIALGWIGVTALPILPVSMDSLLSLTYPEFDPQLTSSILLSCGQFPSMLFLPIAMKVLTLDDYAQCNTTNNFFNIFGHKVHYGLLFTKFGFILMVLMTAMFVMVMNYTGVKQNKRKNKNPTKNQHQQQQKKKKRWCGVI